MARQSEEEPADGGAVARQREHLARTINARMQELGVEERERTTWVHERFHQNGDPVRWQTVQTWFRGESFPQGRRIRMLAKVLGVNFNTLMGPMNDTGPVPASWPRFLETPEGASITDEERWTLRLFPWPADPAVADYRGLLSLLRGNAERRS